MRTVNYWLSLLMIGLMPWMDMVHLPGMGTVSRVAGFGAAAFWVFVVLLTGRTRKPGLLHLLALLFLLWTSLTLFWSQDVDRSWDRMFIYIRMLGMALMIWDLYDSPTMIRSALQVYVLGAYVHAASVFYNFWLGAESVYGRFAATGNIANTTAYVLGMGIPLAWYLATLPKQPAEAANGEATPLQKWGAYLLQWVNFIYFPVAMTAIALTATRFGVIMAVPACLYGLLVLARSYRKLSLVVLIILVAALGFLSTFVPASSFARLAEMGDSIRNGDLTGRVDLWRTAQVVWEEHPIVGIGSDAFPSVNRSGRAVHNTYLVILAETGVIGLAIYLLFLAAIFTTAWRLPNWESVFWLTLLIVWGLTSLVLNLAHDKSIWLFFSLLMANARIRAAEKLTAQTTALAPSQLHTPTRRPLLLTTAKQV